MTQRPPTHPPSTVSRSDADEVVDDVVDEVVDDDGRRDAIPEPDDAASSSERLRAAQFASLLDDAAAGALPAALELETRHNLEIAVALQAVAGQHQLDDATASAMVASVLQNNAVAPAVPTPMLDQLAAQRQRKQARNATSQARMPWIIAATSTLVAAAAIVLLMLRPTVTPRMPATAPLPLAWQSRPADALVGAIDRAQAGNAAMRIDAIYADRLDGYRNARYAQAGVLQ